MGLIGVRDGKNIASSLPHLFKVFSNQSRRIKDTG